MLIKIHQSYLNKVNHISMPFDHGLMLMYVHKYKNYFEIIPNHVLFSKRSKLRTFGTFQNSISILTQTLIPNIVFASLSNILKKTLESD
jgi:hypothetical protein